jgi:hypothetical protein
MSNLPELELYVPPRRQKRQGLGSTVLRALIVMGCLDVALVAIWAAGGFDAAEPDRSVAAAAPSVVANPAPLETAVRTEPKTASVHEVVVARPPHEAEPIAQKEPERAAKETVAPAPAPEPPTAVVVPPEPPPGSVAAAVPPVASPPATEPRPSVSVEKEASPAAPPPRKPERTHRARGASEARYGASLAAPTPKEPGGPARPIAVATVPAAAIPAAAPEAAPELAQRAVSAACKPYFSASSLSGERIPVRGIACPGSDGVWHIITERRIGD